MAKSEATACTVGGHSVVFKNEVKAGDKLGLDDIATIDGKKPTSLPAGVQKFLAGVAG